MDMKITLTRGNEVLEVKDVWIFRIWWRGKFGTQDCTALLFGTGDEDEARIMGALMESGASMQVKDAEGLLQEAVDDLLDKCGADGKFVPPDEERTEAFNSRWRVIAFKRLLDEYGASEKLTFDQAVQAVREYFVVEPVLRS